MEDSVVVAAASLISPVDVLASGEFASGAVVCSVVVVSVVVAGVVIVSSVIDLFLYVGFHRHKLVGAVGNDVVVTLPTLRSPLE